MTPDQVRLVRGTSDVFLAVNTQVADCFYNRLFEIEPQARRLFPADLETLKMKLMNTLATIAGSLNRPEMFRSILVQLGQRHAHFGITDDLYSAGRLALLDSLERALGPRFTAEVRDAWHAVYGEVQGSMTGHDRRLSDT